MKATHEFIGNSSASIVTRSSRANQSNSRNLHQRWNQFWQSIMTQFAGQSEPRISQDREGIWRVYEPATGQALRFISEQEVRSWLDDRYNF